MSKTVLGILAHVDAGRGSLLRKYFKFLFYVFIISIYVYEYYGIIKTEKSIMNLSH